MARISKIKSPAKPAAQTLDSDVEQDELDEDALSPSLELNLVNHLGSDLPDIDPGAWDEETSDIEVRKPLFAAPVANMGASNSHEEISAAVRATAEQPQRYSQAQQQTASRQSAGKLKRPSDVRSNPPYKIPLNSSTARQRKLPTATIFRPSTYDELEEEDSPEKRERREAQGLVNKPAFSPLKKQRKNAPETPRRSTRHQKAQQEQEDDELLKTTPRRSVKKLGPANGTKAEQIDEEESDQLPEENQRSGGPQVVVDIEHDEIAESDGAENEKFRDFVPAHVVRQYLESEAAAGAVDDGARDDDGGMDIDRQDEPAEAEAVDVEDEVIQVQPQKRATPSKARQASIEPVKQQKKTGRAKKTDAQPDEHDSEPALPQTQKRKPGRPKKSGGQPNNVDNSEAVEPVLANALADLRRRRSQIVENKEDGEDEYAAPTSPVQDKSRKEPRPVPKAIIMNKNEVQLGREEAKEGRDVAKQAEKAKSKKRKGSSEQANTTKKRRKSHEGFLAEEAIVNEANQRRLCGQWLPLRHIYRNLEKIGCNTKDGEVQEQNDVDLSDADIVAVMKLCKEARKRYSSLKEHAGGAIDAEQDPASVLEEIKDRVEGLCGQNKDYPTNMLDKDKITQIYFHLIPRLVRLAGHAVFCYEAIDQDDAGDGQVTISHLRILRAMFALILRLGAAAKKYTARPDSDLNIVQPVISGVLVPLRNVIVGFTRRIQTHETEIQQRQRMEDEAQERAVRLEQEERRSRQNARISRWRSKWERLHEERVWAEGTIMSRAKREHLRIPDHHFETDQNGMLFERTEVFVPRVGPPPGLVDEAGRRTWSMIELSSLCDGLRVYAGANVYERIIRRYCRQGRELNRFNVTEIVVTAAGLREKLSVQQRAEYGNVEEWIKTTPVWTKGHHALGKENEEEEEEAIVAVEDLVVET